MSVKILKCKQTCFFCVCVCVLPDVNAVVDGAAMTLGDELSSM